MKIEKATQTEIVFRPSRHEETHTAFIFDFSVVPLNVTPKRVFFISRLNRGKKWGMTWKAFGKETVFVDKKGHDNDVALIRKEHMNIFKAGQ